MGRFDMRDDELAECPDAVLLAIARNAQNHFDQVDRNVIFNEVLRRYERGLYLISAMRQKDHE